MKAKWGVAVFLMATASLAQNPDVSKGSYQSQDVANETAGSHDIQRKVRDLCQAAALDEKKYGKKCSQARGELSKALGQFQADLAMGRHELQQKDYAGALRDLQKITFGSDKEEAQALIQQARIGLSGGVPVDPESLKSYKAAQEAYLRGDFDSAEAQARGVQSPTLQPEVNQILTNIHIYRDTMKQADAMFSADDLKGAEQKYQFAAMILQNGPGSPMERLQDVLSAERRAEAARQQLEQSSTDVHPAIQEKQTQSSKMDHVSKSKSMVSMGRHEEAAIRDAKSIRHADGGTGNEAESEIMQGDPNAVDAILNKGVVDFYASHFTQADDAIGVYLQHGGKDHAGTAHFYLGASLFMQALLTSSQNQSRMDALRQQAEEQFLLAKQLRYKPLESAVSPKVFAEWTRIGDGR